MTKGVYLGADPISSLSVGSTSVTGVYQGSTEIWTPAPSNWISLIMSVTQTLSGSDLSLTFPNVEAGDIIYLIGGGSTINLAPKDNSSNSYSAFSGGTGRSSKLKATYAMANAANASLKVTQTWSSVGNGSVMGFLFRGSSVTKGSNVTVKDSSFVTGTTYRNLSYTATSPSLIVGVFDNDGDASVQAASSDSDFVADNLIGNFTFGHAIKNSAVTETFQYNFPTSNTIWSAGLITSVLKSS